MVHYNAPYNAVVDAALFSGRFTLGAGGSAAIRGKRFARTPTQGETQLKTTERPLREKIKT